MIKTAKHTRGMRTCPFHMKRNSTTSIYNLRPNAAQTYIAPKLSVPPSLAVHHAPFSAVASTFATFGAFSLTGACFLHSQYTYVHTYKQTYTYTRTFAHTHTVTQTAIQTHRPPSGLGCQRGSKTKTTRTHVNLIRAHVNQTRAQTNKRMRPKSNCAMR